MGSPWRLPCFVAYLALVGAFLAGGLIAYVTRIELGLERRTPTSRLATNLFGRISEEAHRRRRRARLVAAAVAMVLIPASLVRPEFAITVISTMSAVLVYGLIGLAIWTGIDRRRKDRRTQSV